MTTFLRTTRLVRSATAALLLAGLPTAMFLSGCDSKTSTEEVPRDVSTETAATPAGTLEESMVGDTVHLTGEVVEQCPASGCWMKIRGGNGETFVDLLPSPVRLSENRVGQQAQIAGEVVRRGSELAIKALQVEFTPSTQDAPQGEP